MRPWLTELADEGQCGDDIYFAYDAEKGTVSVTGTGSTWDYDYVQGPMIVSKIFKVNGTVRRLVIGSGITELMAGFIPENSDLETILIPRSVEKIGHSNFHSGAPVCIIYEGTHTEWDAINIDELNFFEGCTLICAGEWFKAPGKGYGLKPHGLNFNVKEGELPAHTAFRPALILSREEAMNVVGSFENANLVPCPAAFPLPSTWYKSPVSWADGWGLSRGNGSSLVPYSCCGTGDARIILYKCGEVKSAE